jgi:polyhydroxybutyrate depolymerase
VVSPVEDSEFVFPKSAEAKRAAFVMFLHGLGGSGPLARRALALDRLAEQMGFAFVAPSGARDRFERRYWNAPGCCDFDHVGLDHTGLLTELLRKASQDPRIDPGRVFVYGFSNGGYMAHHLACTEGVPLTGIVSVAGVPPARNVKCHPRPRLTVIQVHGDKDVVVPMQGGYLFGEPKYPVVEPIIEGMTHWTSVLGCQELAPHRQGRLDLVASLPGQETLVNRWGHCRGTLELLEIAGGTHLNVNASGILRHVLGSLLASTGNSK